MPALLNARRESFCLLYSTLGNAFEAYVQAGYSKVGANQSASRLLKIPEIKQRLTELQPISLPIQTLRGEIAVRQSRVDALQDRWERMKQVIAERAAAEVMQTAPGGKTGLLAVTYKTQTSTDYAGEKPQRITELVPEFEVDVALLREMRAHEEQAARELGQWVEKQDINLKAQVSQVSVTLAAALQPEELRALEGKLLQLQASQPGVPAVEDEK